MAGRGNLPHVVIRTHSGMVTAVEIDGETVRGLKVVSFNADSQGGYPVVRLELWATVELTGEVAVLVGQDRHVQRCSRPHVGEGGPTGTHARKTAPESSSDDSEPSAVMPGVTA